MPMVLFMVVPVIPVVRFTFQEQPSAFVLTLPDTAKTHSHPPLAPHLGRGCSDSGREAERPLCYPNRPDCLWWASFALYVGEQQLGMSCDALLMDSVHIAYIISLLLWVSILEGFKLKT